MKLLLLATLFALAPTIASAATLEVENHTWLRASLGEFYGTMVPSICEDGPCWQEVNVKFHPYLGYERIQLPVSLAIGGRKRATFLDVESLGSYEITGPCADVAEGQRAYHFALSGTAHLRKIGFRSICLAEPTGHLIVD